MSLIPKEIEEHYLRGQESERLSGARGELEQFRTQAILAQNLPRGPADIFDVGGASGIHAFPLATQGYRASDRSRGAAFIASEILRSHGGCHAQNNHAGRHSLPGCSL